MYSPLQSGWRYLKYYCAASNGKGHGIHSPFVFEFVTRVLNDDRHFYAYSTIENLRRLMLSDPREVLVEDIGAGTGVQTIRTRKVKDLASSSLKTKKYGQLLFRMIEQYTPGTILELGSSLGITTAYLASAGKKASVITMETAAAVAELAQQNFRKLQLNNIRMITGNFDETLQPTIAELGKIDLACIDGNHRYETTLRYYHELLPALHEQSILVFDDIHQSKEMEKAWNEIRRQPGVTVSIDLFFTGLIFFRKENKVKQDFTIRF
jgi:predicted O-methyltransferase YrrM